MSNDPQLTKKMKTTTPVTIAPAKASLKKNQQEGRKEIHPVVEHTKNAKKLSEDTGGNIGRRREGIYVLRATRSRRSRSRILDEETE
mmetsp:Transcript_3698/g.4101  ORF Transcript_3698/g.4101 Transcript_3698/m.4101 type:complete len:87 (+) Transcript_3698:243-503(+)